MAFHLAEHENPLPALALEPSWRTADELHTLQSRLLQTMVEACSIRHPRYQLLFREHRIVPGDIRSVDDLPLLPLTTKQEFIEDPDSYRLEADPGSGHDSVLADVTYTAGTTSGSPTPIYQTAYDLRALLFAQLRMAMIRGLQRGDRVVNLYPFAPYPHGGWLRPTQAAATLGAPVVAATGGSEHGRFPITRRMREVAGLTVDTDPTVVWGVPSYVDRVFRQILSDGGSLPSLRMIAVSGEPCTSHRRSTLIDLASKLGATDPFVSDSLGASELQFSLVECPQGHGFHHPAPELAHIDVVDDAGRSIGDGESGRLVYTHLDRMGTVLLRFLVGDRAILDRSPCPGCGWPGGRIVEHLGREGNLIKVRGALINVDAVHASIERNAGVVDHRVEIDTREGMDVLYATIALREGEEIESVRRSVVDSVQSATGVRPDVVVTDLDQIWSPDHKMKPARFTDKRGAAGVMQGREKT